MKPKYGIGQTVQVKDDKEIGKVVGFSYDEDRGFTYKVTSREVDITEKRVLNGVKTLAEDELQTPSKKDAAKYNGDELEEEEDE